MVCFMGFLHIEMTSQDCGGKLLAGSDWDSMFSLAKIFTTGIASSLLAGKHVKRTRYAYQLTLAWLHVLKLQAYDEYCREGYGPHEPIEMWEKRLISNAPTINYWTTVREYLLVNCRFIEWAIGCSLRMLDLEQGPFTTPIAKRLGRTSFRSKRHLALSECM